MRSATVRPGPSTPTAATCASSRTTGAAHAFVTRSVAAAEACPEEQHGATRWIHSVSPGDVGEESAQILQTYETDGTANVGATWWDVTRVGNAVLLTATGGEYLPGETLGQRDPRPRRADRPDRGLDVRVLRDWLLRT